MEDPVAAEVAIDRRKADTERQDELRRWAAGVFCAVAVGSLLLEVLLVGDPVRTAIQAVAAAISLLVVALVWRRRPISRR